MSKMLAKINLPPFAIALLAPIGMVAKSFSRCFRFLFLNLVFGLLGVYVGLLTPIFFSSYSFSRQFSASLAAGDFYVFTIAFLSSTTVLLLESQPKRPDVHVAKLKPTLVLIIVALIAFSAVGAVMQTWQSTIPMASLPSSGSFQKGLFLAGVLVAFYGFLVAIYEEELDDYATVDNARRGELVREASTVSTDGRGITV